ncbi:NUDIX hydrolase [Alicyclobacillus mengziensis]|nr:NUDIX hydrolase [Alicyclobacillus mengziensis]
MVRQHVSRGDVVWNFPGGHVEVGETTEEACVREVREETGYDVLVTGLISEAAGKYTYRAKIVGGSLFVDTTLIDNEDIVEARWIRLDDYDKFDDVTRLLIDKVVCA